MKMVLGFLSTLSELSFGNRATTLWFCEVTDSILVVQCCNCRAFHKRLSESLNNVHFLHSIDRWFNGIDRWSDLIDRSKANSHTM